MGYLHTLYSEERKPYTSYPPKLCRYLVESYFKDSYRTLLDVGCGRGEHLKEFFKLGFQVRGVDLLEEAKELCGGLRVDILDVDTQPLPYKDESFDVIFNKSLIEHLYNPDNFMKEAYRVLRPGGRLITMTPDWEAVYKTFYDDYTHRTPFTEMSLYNIHLIHSFKIVKLGKFIQLPFLWGHPWLFPLTKILYYFPKSRIKWIKFSKEGMLLSVGEK